MGVSNTYNFKFGVLPKGKLNLITDVPNVAVSNITIKSENINTGVTAILPHRGNMFKDKILASSHVVNGFGKSIGLIQVDELGTLETPILLTNTFSVATASSALIKYMLNENTDIGDTTSTVNPVVFECNDGFLNDIRGMHITEEHCFQALQSAGEIFDEGDCGAGTGMTCYGLKGGIGSSSRIVTIGENKYTVGALLLTNFGTLRDLTICGDKIGEKIYEKKQETNIDKGSCIMIIATDAPLSSRQLKRIARRAQSGLARTGTISGNGSGEIAFAFSTANIINHYGSKEPISIKILNDDYINDLFRATIECVEESVVSSLIHAKSLVGRKSHKRDALCDFIK